MLVEVTDRNQISFLPPRFILDNIILIHQSIQWAKESQQDSFFLKLDVSKAYDRVHWVFMFKVVEKLGMPNSFINMFRLLFQDASVSIQINNQVTNLFDLHRGV